MKKEIIIRKKDGDWVFNVETKMGETLSSAPVNRKYESIVEKIDSLISDGRIVNRKNLLSLLTKEERIFINSIDR